MAKAPKMPMPPQGGQSFQNTPPAPLMTGGITPTAAPVKQPRTGIQAKNAMALALAAARMKKGK